MNSQKGKKLVVDLDNMSAWYVFEILSKIPIGKYKIKYDGINTTIDELIKEGLL